MYIRNAPNLVSSLPVPSTWIICNTFVLFVNLESSEKKEEKLDNDVIWHFCIYYGTLFVLIQVKQEPVGVQILLALSGAKV